WKTTDGGGSWFPVTDGQIGSASVGAVAIDPKDPDVLYIGMGEGELRGNVLQGDGVYKSADGGREWRHLGLAETRTITSITVHPNDSSLIYVTALGDPFAASEARGVYRSRNGGETWERILFTSDKAGAIDLSLDPANPDVLYATLWEVYRKPWKLWSGGSASAIFKSLDGGDSWTDITGNPGLPRGPLGKMTIAVSPADSKRVYANIEAEKGGLYRSDDAGESWQHMNGSRKLWQRSFYFMGLKADPVDRDTIYVLSFKLEKSVDGGASFNDVPTRHADVHDLWIDPADPQRMIVADDGGASVSVNGGYTWTEQDFPTAQIYRLSTTDEFPYRLCGTQQDNTAVCVPSRPAKRLRSVRHVDSFNDHETVATSENGFVAAHPEEAGVFFVSTSNRILRVDTQRQQWTNVSPYPYAVMGQTAASMRERWNWITPVVFSPADNSTLYVGSQHLWRSRDSGQSWKKISPDLTRNDKSTQGETGGPVRLDQDGPEVYGTIYAIAPSARDDQLIWTGSDDGRVQLTRNGGSSWEDVSPTELPEHSRIADLVASRHRDGAAYFAAKRYEMGDRRPYVFRTDDFGRSWQRIDGAIPSDEFVHSIAEDPEVPGLLYLGTEHAVHMSPDHGESWLPLSLNLPRTPVMGISVKGNELAIATHGRSFFVLEGLRTLRHLVTEGPPGGSLLYPPADGYFAAIPVSLHLHLAEAVAQPELRIVARDGTVVRRLPVPDTLDPGDHRFDWNLRHDAPEGFPGMVLEAPLPYRGPNALPGRYRAVFTSAVHEFTREFAVLPDPRQGELSLVDLEQQLTLALEVGEAVATANAMVREIRRLRNEVDAVTPGGGTDVAAASARLLDSLAPIEEVLYQVRNESPKDKIAYPIQLNDRLSMLYGDLTLGTGKPTAPQRQVFSELMLELESARMAYAKAMATELAEFNTVLEAAGRAALPVSLD
ncbi:MAG: glycosyl hydrolase, partial [Pseudomonadota bacterium]